MCQLRRSAKCPQFRKPGARGKRCAKKSAISEIERCVMEATKYKSLLHQTAMTTATDYWNDSCSVEELNYAIENGAVGATSNPTIVHMVLKKEMHLWKERVYAIIRENPTW